MDGHSRISTVADYEPEEFKLIDTYPLNSGAVTPFKEQRVIARMQANLPKD
jgi:hypothetical protein